MLNVTPKTLTLRNMWLKILNYIYRSFRISSFRPFTRLSVSAPATTPFDFARNRQDDVFMHANARFDTSRHAENSK